MFNEDVFVGPIISPCLETIFWWLSQWWKPIATEISSWFSLSSHFHVKFDSFSLLMTRKDTLKKHQWNKSSFGVQDLANMFWSRNIIRKQMFKNWYSGKHGMVASGHASHQWHVFGQRMSFNQLTIMVCFFVANAKQRILRCPSPTQPVGPNGASSKQMYVSSMPCVKTTTKTIRTTRTTRTTWRRTRRKKRAMIRTRRRRNTRRTNKEKGHKNEKKKSKKEKTWLRIKIKRTHIENKKEKLNNKSNNRNPRVTQQQNDYHPVIVRLEAGFGIVFGHDNAICPRSIPSSNWADLRAVRTFGPRCWRSNGFFACTFQISECSQLIFLDCLRE